MTPKGSDFVDKRKLDTLLPIDQLDLHWSDLSITQDVFKEICSINAPLNHELALNEVFIEEFGLSLPEPGKMINYSKGSIFWVSPAQWFITSNECNPYFDQQLATQLKNIPSVTLQTDGWISLKIKGKASLNVLERLVKLNLNDRYFPTGSATRTGCSHMTIFLQKPPQKNYFIMIGARSYSKSLIHAVNQAAENVLGKRE